MRMYWRRPSRGKLYRNAANYTIFTSGLSRVSAVENELTVAKNALSTMEAEQAAKMADDDVHEDVEDNEADQHAVDEAASSHQGRKHALDDSTGADEPPPKKHRSVHEPEVVDESEDIQGREDETNAEQLIVQDEGMNDDDALDVDPDMEPGEMVETDEAFDEFGHDDAVEQDQDEDIEIGDENENDVDILNEDEVHSVQDEEDVLERGREQEQSEEAVDAEEHHEAESNLPMRRLIRRRPERNTVVAAAINATREDAEANEEDPAERFVDGNEVNE
jgi:hypothetical protein